MTFSIWLEPTMKDSIYLKNIIKELAKNYGSDVFDPHITLFSGIERSNLAVSAIKHCHSHRSVRTRIIDIKSSEVIWKTVFVNVQNNPSLLQLNHTIKKIAGMNNTYRFQPHISLIYKILDSKTKREIIKKLKIKSTFCFDKISAIKSSQDISEWRKLETVHLHSD